MTEKEAIAELGDPQLIAKTIIESTDRAAEAAGYEGPYRSSTDSYDDSEFIYSGTQEEAGDRTRSKEKGDQENRKSGTGCTVAVVMLILALLIAWTLTSFVFRLGIHLLGWLFPLLAVIAIFALIIRIFRRR